MSPAFLVHHASLTADLFGILMDLKSRDVIINPTSAESDKFEKKLYTYVLYLITMFVPGATLDTNSREVSTPADFVKAFKRFTERVQSRRAYLATTKKEMALPETYVEVMNYLQYEVYRILEIYQEPTAIDKTIVALENYIRFTFLHNHIIKRWTPYDVIEEMKGLYHEISKYIRRKKFPLHVRAGIDILIASLELIQPSYQSADIIPPPPPESPVLRHSSNILEWGNGAPRYDELGSL